MRNRLLQPERLPSSPGTGRVLMRSWEYNGSGLESPRSVRLGVNSPNTQHKDSKGLVQVELVRPEGLNVFSVDHGRVGVQVLKPGHGETL